MKMGEQPTDEANFFRFQNEERFLQLNVRIRCPDKVSAMRSHARGCASTVTSLTPFGNFTILDLVLKIQIKMVEKSDRLAPKIVMLALMAETRKST